MILVDTSIWIDHLSAVDSHLSELLDGNEVLMHPWILGELACGHLANRRVTLESLQDLPEVSVAGDEEVRFLIEEHKLMGRGIGYLDMHLLAAVKLHRSLLWSRDKRLLKAAAELQVAHMPPPGSGLPS